MRTNIAFALLLALLMPLSALADDNVLRLTGRICDRSADTLLPKTHWAVYDSLDCLVDSAKTPKRTHSPYETAVFSMSVPRVDATYRLVFAKEGYDTTECYYRVEKIGRRELSRPIGTYYLSPSRDAIMLNEVTVTASKVKFYHRGDTLVYNADAFLLSEGSMLDALIAQLPGVEIRSNGQIYVNGRYVESLLLNGKDFFKSDKNVLLNNLGAYTVKNIEVYEKRGELSEFLGRDLDSDKEYVMDVKLKKEYSVGWMANVEGGYGSNDRYLGRIFGLNYSTHNRFSVWGNVNNMGSNQRPGQDSGFGFMDNANNTNSGRAEIIKGGIDYAVDKNKARFNGNASVGYANNQLNSATASVNYLPEANNYSYARSNNKTSNLSIITWNSFSNTSDYVYWQISPSYSYSNSDGSSANAQAMYRSELTGEQWMNLLDRLISGDLSTEMRDSLINQSLRTSGNSSISQNASANANATIKFRGSNDWLSASINTDYSYSHFYNHNRYLINYGDEAVPGLGQRQRTANRPDRNFDMRANLDYNYTFSSKTRLSIKYGFDERWCQKTSNIYMAQIQADATGRFDLLALAQMKETLDANNSYVSHDHTSTHTVATHFEHKLNISSYGGALIVDAPIQILTKRLDYTRGSVDVDPRHTWCLVDGGSVIFRLSKNGSKYSRSSSVSYSLNMSAPDLMSMIDIVNDADPLNIQVGNPHLRPSLTHNLSLSSSIYAMGSPRQVYGSIGGTYQQRSISTGYSLDPSTGVRRYKAYNVDGNWSASISGGFFGCFGKDQQWITNINAFASYNKYTSLISLGAGEPQPSDAYALNVVLMPDVSFKHRGISATAGMFASWTRSTNRGFAPSNVGYANPYVSIRAQLPARFDLQSRLQMYNRIGMSDPALSKPQWVWVATLSYTPSKNWTISLDGFDILRQLTQAQVSVNAQGRIEMYSNTLPSYFMARLQYRLSISPKKEKPKPITIN